MLRGLRIPQFRAYSSEIVIKGEKVSTQYIECYLRYNLFTLKGLHVFNKLLKEINPNESYLTFRELYDDFIKAKRDVEQLQKQIRKLKRKYLFPAERHL